MKKNFIISIAPEETRMALLEDGQLAEYAVERSESGHIVGNIYKGRVQNVLPGIQAAFVDIGRDKNAFIHLQDITSYRTDPESPVTAGEELLVQVVKDAGGTKGPRLTTQLTLPGRYAVLMPTVDFLGVSRRIGCEEERRRLRQIAEEIRPAGMGMIVRTVAEGKHREELAKDVAYLTNLWATLGARAKRAKAPALLYRDVDLVIRIVRDYLSADVERVVIDSRDAHARMGDLLAYVSPELVPRLELYEGEEDVFARFAVSDHIGALGERRVPLECGGYIVIDRTEALTVIDVNTGKFVGRTARAADTILTANLEAAAVIAGQLRLRDIGGIIVIDFIDMEREEERQAVLDALAGHLKRDRTKTNVVGITGLGLVEMTRKKSRQDLGALLYSECPCCGGRGFVQSPETVAIAITRQLRQLSKDHASGRRLVVHASPPVAEVLRRPGELDRLGRELSRRITVEAVPAMNCEAYSILKGKE